MSDTDDLIGDDPEMEKFADDFERHRKALYEHICGFMEDEEIDEAYLAQLLIDAAISMRMTAYGLGVESPSAAGLKIDLDRLRNEIGEFVREAKRGAEEYIRHVKEVRASAEAEGDLTSEEQRE
ncbi:MAG TPA: hypothetical protein VIY51_19530 [Xanthobacteraceae bacterium]